MTDDRLTEALVTQGEAESASLLEISERARNSSRLKFP